MKRTLVIALMALALPAGAQTTDGFWQHWTSREEHFAPRAAALGGADAALTDDAGAAVTNPGLLATTWRTELIAGVGHARRTEFTQLQASRSSPEGVSASAYVRWPASFSESSASSRLDSELTEGGALFARHVSKRFSLGAGINVTRLAFTGESAATASGARLRAGAGAASTRVGGSVGAVWHDYAWTAGAAFHTGSTFAATRTSTLDGAWDDRGSTFAVRRPWRLVFGGSFRRSLRLSFFAQADVRGPGTLRAIAAPTLASAGAAAAAQAPERAGLGALRAAAEYALPLERVSIVFRAGVARLADAGLRTAVTAPNAKVLIASAAAKTRVTAGIGIAWEMSAIDVAYDGAGKWTIEARARLWR